MATGATTPVQVGTPRAGTTEALAGLRYGRLLSMAQVGGVPELDVARVRRWCRGRVPSHQRNEIRVECDVAARHLTILECRPAPSGDRAGEWIQEPLARLRYTASLQEWTLYWRDGNQKFRRYGGCSHRPGTSRSYWPNSMRTPPASSGASATGCRSYPSPRALPGARHGRGAATHPIRPSITISHAYQGAGVARGCVGIGSKAGCRDRSPARERRGPAASEPEDTLADLLVACVNGTKGEDMARGDGIGEDDLSYFGIQSRWGVTKHVGGRAATDRLVDLCGISADSKVLEVGCGVGVTSCYLVRKVGCSLTSIDLNEQMVQWARMRAVREGVADRIAFDVADAQALPFADGSFDAVISESVTAFAPDRARAVREYRRVRVPGGRVGLTEASWVRTLRRPTWWSSCPARWKERNS